MTFIDLPLYVSEREGAREGEIVQVNALFSGFVLWDHTLVCYICLYVVIILPMIILRLLFEKKLYLFTLFWVSQGPVVVLVVPIHSGPHLSLGPWMTL